MKNGKQLLFWIVAVILIMVMMNGQKEGKKESSFSFGTTEQSSCDFPFNSVGNTCVSSCRRVNQEIVDCTNGKNILSFFGDKLFTTYYNMVTAKWAALTFTSGSCSNLGYYGDTNELGLYQCFTAPPAICTTLRSSAWNAALAWVSNPTASNKNNAVNSIISWAGAC